jgi:DNA-binding FrmR family transcriptional regulator
MTTHKSHPDIVKRLRRASGHLDRVAKMIAEESPCLAIAQQLQAVISALSSAKTILVQDHIENCITTALEDGTSGSARQKIQEFKEIAKYL